VDTEGSGSGDEEEEKWGYSPIICDISSRGRYRQILIIITVMCVTFPITTGVFGFTMGIQLNAIQARR